VYDGCFRAELPLTVSALRQDAYARVALVIDELRKARGHSVILRGHDFLLRNGPRESTAERKPSPAPEAEAATLRTKVVCITFRCAATAITRFWIQRFRQ
jgi:hypothetical protein